MTDDEVTALLSRIEVVWTRGPLSRAGAREWQQALRRTPSTEAHDVINDMIGRGATPPNLAQFMGALSALHPTNQPSLFLGGELHWEGPTDEGRLAAKRARAILDSTPAWVRPHREVDLEEEA